MLSSISSFSVEDQFRRVKNYLALTTLSVLALTAIAPLVFISTYLVIRGWQGISIHFFTELPRPIGESGGGLANALLGSSVLLVLTILIGVPTGLLGGIALFDLRKTATAKVLRLVIDLLASVPSIVVGLFIYAVIVVPMGGYSAWAGGLALSIISVPIVARSTEEILKLVPRNVFEAGLALGLPRWKVLLRLILPGVRSGVLTGVLLALARVSGETAPLLFTAFSSTFGYHGLSNPVASLPVEIYTHATSHDEVWRQLAWTGALVLVFIVFSLNLLTRIFLRNK